MIKKYYYYKCKTGKPYFNEIDIEKELKAFMLELAKQDDLINNYYTPFIKSKLEDKTEDYKKEIKDRGKDFLQSEILKKLPDSKIIYITSPLMIY